MIGPRPRGVDYITTYVECTVPCKDEHRAMWPGIAVPGYHKLHASGRAYTIWAPASLVVAALVCLFRKTKRSKSSRHTTFLFLKSMVEAACALGVDLTTTHIDVDGNVTDHSFQVHGDPSVDACHLWDLDFYHTYISNDWLNANNSQEPEWVSSPGGRPHLADWLAYVLDCPQTDSQRTLRRAGIEELAAAKKVYSGSALGILTQLAYRFNNVLPEVTEPMGSDVLMKDKGLQVFDFKMFSARFIEGQTDRP